MGLERLLDGTNFSTDFTVVPRQFLERIVVHGYNSSLDHNQIVEALKNATESKEVRNLYMRDMRGIFGRALNKVLDWKGYKSKMPDHYTYLDLPEQVMAATITTENGKVILAYNRKHADKLRSNSLLRKYVNLHEQGHVRGEKSESTTEGLVGYAASMVKRAMKPLYKWSKKAKDAFEEATAIGQYAHVRERAQYGR